MNFRKRKSKDYALNRFESNFFMSEGDQLGFAAQSIEDEMQQTKM